MEISSTTVHLPRGADVEVPAELLVARPGTGLYDYVILGAGCAGLSAAVALLDAGATGSILLIDPRTDYRDDRTWCFWEVEPTPFSHLARGRWSTWEVRAAPGTVDASAPRTPYLSIAANDFYADALDRLAASGTVTMLCGEAATGYVDTDGSGVGTGVDITTSHHRVRGRQVIDARGLRIPSSATGQPASRSVWLPQAFVGLHIVTERPVFDPQTCVLMDFTVDQSCGLRFMYLVPVSATEALVENVFLTETPLSDAAFVAGIELYLAREFGLERHDYSVLSSERGCIPMTDFPFDERPSPHVTVVGTLGGATRPSTGYTFLRIQRSCRALAARLVTDRPSPADEAPDAPRHVPATPAARQNTSISPRSLLDAIFLRFLADHPERAPLVFHRMFAAVDPDALVRFLSDQSGWRDHARLIIALPKGWFLAAAARVLVNRVGRAEG